MRDAIDEERIEPPPTLAFQREDLMTFVRRTRPTALSAYQRGFLMPNATFLIAALVALSMFGCATAPPALQDVTVEEFRVPARAPGIELYIRNKHPNSLRRFEEDRTILFVHGAAFPSESTFDLALDGVSWMDHLASTGYDVYLIDLRGFGRSTRLPEMDQPPETHGPLISAEEAADDVGAAVEFIKRRRGVGKLDLLGWSWGSLIMGLYAGKHPENVHKLVLYGPAWVRAGALQAGSNRSGNPGSGAATAYQTVDVRQAKKRWLAGVPEAKQAELLPPTWFEAWVAANVATDRHDGATPVDGIRVPNRVPLLAGKEPYDPAAIRAPVLLVRGEWDIDTPAEMSRTLFGRLTHAPFKEYVEIGESTHSVMLERHRRLLFDAVQQFLQ